MRNGPRDILLAEALFEVLKLLKLMEKVDARMDCSFLGLDLNHGII